MHAIEIHGLTKSFRNSYAADGLNMTKRSLLAVGEIKPEGRTSARKLNENAEQ